MQENKNYLHCSGWRNDSLCLIQLVQRKYFSSSPSFYNSHQYYHCLHAKLEFQSVPQVPCIVVKIYCKHPLALWKADCLVEPMGVTIRSVAMVYRPQLPQLQLASDSGGPPPVLYCPTLIKQLDLQLSRAHYIVNAGDTWSRAIVLLFGVEQLCWSSTASVYDPEESSVSNSPLVNSM